MRARETLHEIGCWEAVWVRVSQMIVTDTQETVFVRGSPNEHTSDNPTNTTPDKLSK